jgi:hypothetical protein
VLRPAPIDQFGGEDPPSPAIPPFWMHIIRPRRVEFELDSPNSDVWVAIQLGLEKLTQFQAHLERPPALPSEFLRGRARQRT